MEGHNHGYSPPAAAAAAAAEEEGAASSPRLPAPRAEYPSHCAAADLSDFPFFVAFP